MKKYKLIGIVLGLFAFAIGVSYFSDVSKTKKIVPSSQYVLSDLSVLADLDNLIPLINRPEPVSYCMQLFPSPFSIKTIGVPKTKFVAQKYFYPLKLC